MRIGEQKRRYWHMKDARHEAQGVRRAHRAQGTRDTRHYTSIFIYFLFIYLFIYYRYSFSLVLFVQIYRVLL